MPTGGLDMAVPAGVSYAEGANWESWQRDYLLGVILIVPPEDVREPIDRLRARYGPVSHRTCAAHISVSDPLGREMTPDVEDEIRGALRRVEPFRLYFETLYASNEYPGVAYRIHPDEPVRALQQILHATRAFGPVPSSRREIPPHMTVAEFISIDESLRLCAALQDNAPKGSFLCDRMEYIVPDDSFVFHSVRTFHFAATPPQRHVDACSHAAADAGHEAGEEKAGEGAGQRDRDHAG
jgi:2'-5' RNA ligase